MIDAVVCKCLASQLQFLIGSRITAAAQPSPLQACLELRLAGGIKHTLWLSAHARWGRLHTEKGELDKSPATHLTSIFNHHIVGGFIKEIIQRPWERIIDIIVRKRDLISGYKEHTISIELMGKHANIIVISSDGMILDAIKRIGTEQSRVRSVFPGVTYEGPPPRPGDTPDAWQPQLPPDRVNVRTWLIGGIKGMSPVWVRELCHNTGINPKVDVNTLSQHQIQALASNIHTMASAIKRCEFEPTGYADDHGLSHIWAFPLNHVAGYQTITGNTINELIGQLYHDQERKEQFTNQRTRINTRIKQLLQSASRKVKQHSAAACKAKDSSKFKLWGQLLTTYSFQIRHRADSADLPDFNDPNTIHHVPIDPDLTPIENARHYFNRYRKLQSSAQKAERKLTQARQHQFNLSQFKQQLEQSTTIDQLNDIEATLSKPPRKQKLISPSYLTLQTPAGNTLLVGRNDNQNEIVTFSKASAHDLWFHVQNMTGAHVVLKLSHANAEPSQQCLQYAADIAAHFSAGRRSTTVPVDFTEKKNVRRRPGTKKGQALYENYATIIARPKPPQF